ncbi:LPXTG cell wall anchor domain-containing protein, partial [Candidatus Saccharibacteria bacterium]|nr:LPXTG cell wall anchor domain-containing protein [Candidatus Saccharibacteria bacterium]
FSAKVAASQTEICTPTTLHNVATALTNNGSKSDSADVVVPVTKECAPGTINVCQLSTKTIIKIKETNFDASKHSKNLDDCKTTVTPPELPRTGMTENIVAVIGLGAIVASAAYYIASRRALS